MVSEYDDVSQAPSDSSQWEAHAVITTTRTKHVQQGMRAEQTHDDSVIVTASSPIQARIRARVALQGRYPDAQIRITSVHRVGE